MSNELKARIKEYLNNVDDMASVGMFEEIIYDANTLLIECMEEDEKNA